MKRRGQIFLIMTILVITFMVGISTVLLQVQRSNYTDTVPDSENVLIAWENAYSSIEQILEIELSICTTSGALAGVRDISLPLGNLENYLTNIGLSAIITVDPTSPVTYSNVGATTLVNTAGITGRFYIHLQSGNVQIDQSMVIDLSYSAQSVPDGILTKVIITKTVNSEKMFIIKSTLSAISSTFTDLQNGAYISVVQIPASEAIAIQTPLNIALDIVAP